MAKTLNALALAAMFGVMALSFAHAPSAHAQGVPVEITADNGLEWSRDAKSVTASGNAIARRGDVTVRANKLVARYGEDARGKTQITRISAEGGVRIAAPGHKAQGGLLTYSPLSKLARLSGKGLQLTTRDTVITATEALEYDQIRRLAVARGRANVARDGNELSADSLKAQFKAGSGGGSALALDEVTADGSVTITTSRGETARGDTAKYNADTQTATLTGNVVIERQGNRLAGQTATVNMATGVSRLTGGAGGSGRVRGVFLPGGDNELEIGR
ncbi:MAG: hypothetical protein Alpg2KO_32030 [Alphaproteobacteria bacterium]